MRTAVVRLLVGSALAIPLWSAAQPARIGMILHSSSYAPVFDGLRIGLKEQGIVEGRDVLFDVVDAKGDVKLIEQGARRFESQGVKLVYVVPMSAATVVKRATNKVTIFFCVGSDPVAGGMVDSFAKPGGRVTGVHYMTTDLTAKRLELLKDLLPQLRSILVLYNPAHIPAQASMRAAKPAAVKLGIKVIERQVRSITEIRAAIASLMPGDADALFMIADAAVTSRFEEIIRAARAIRMPVIGFESAMVERGALISYGTDLADTGRQSAKNVRRLLADAQPADLPVENVTRLHFVLNRSVAKDLGVPVAPAMMVRFDRVIE
jgi:putative ABC transport system substrate-binding protein